MGKRFANKEDASNFDEFTEQDIDAIKQKIEQHISSLCAFLSNNASWSQERFDKSQRQLIADILLDLSLGNNVILEAPTGTGKSIIALFVATFMQSYILTSDKMLQDQYEQFINHMMLKNIAINSKPQFTKLAVLKGQDNYACSLTNLPFTTCQFQETGLSLNKIYNTVPCGKKCPYLSTRQKAIESQCAVFNYAYWLMQMHVNRFGPFERRAVTIFDECHKIDDILQNFMDISIGPQFIQNCSKAESIVAVMKTTEEQAKYVELKESLFSEIRNIIALISTGSIIDAVRLSIESLIECSTKLHELLANIDELLAEKLENTQSLSTIESGFRRFVGKLSEIEFGLQTMFDATIESPSDLLVILKQETNSISFKCVNDALLAKSLVHTATETQLWMSATIGDIDEFAKLNAIDNYTSYSLQSTFNFDKSPIYICRPLISLSYKNKNENLPKMLQYIDDIIDKYDSDNGVIHTSTREITNYILANSRHSRRMLTYQNADDKRYKLSLINDKTNYILVGYSVTEGVDLPDDKCRLQIVAKLAWQHLGDLVVSTKASNHPEWYLLKTQQQFIQGIGRGIRHENDWCHTYVIDSSYSRISSKLKFSAAMQARIQDCQMQKQAMPSDIADDDFFKNFL